MQNKNKANLILGAVFIVFVLLTVLKYSFRNSFILGLLAFAAEASLVGGIADWFAVTALFRKPLGFSWHTAIVPRNRGKIIEKISEIVEKELLSMEALKNRLAGVELIDALLDRLTEFFDRGTMENGFKDFFGEKAGSVDTAKLASDVETFVKEGLSKENVSAWLRDVIADAFREGKQSRWLEAMLGKASEMAAKPAVREKINGILKEQEKRGETSQGTGAVLFRTLLGVSRSSKHTNLYTISEILQKELVDTLTRIGNPGDPIFNRLSDNSAHLIKLMDEDKALEDIIQTWKKGILERVDLAETLRKLAGSIIESEMHRDEAAAWLASHLDGYWRELREDAGMKQWIDGIFKNMLEKIIASEHHLIGEVVTETLESFTNDRLVRFIEEKAGNDLQWIRINGSIVGAAAGTLLYLFAQLLYGPYIVPLIQRVLGM